MEALRQPLEEGIIRVSRARGSLAYPARLLLVAATNPCPCGEGGPPGAVCRCPSNALDRYRRRLSGPLLDRFDLRVDMARPSEQELVHGSPGEASAVVAQRVLAARERAAARGVTCNAELDQTGTERFTPLTDGAKQVLERALRRGSLSARGLARVRRVALTLADLAGLDGPLTADGLMMALELRVHTGVAGGGGRL